MTFAETVLKVVDNLYPGLLDEESTFFDVYRIGAPLNSVFVQARIANPLSSAALQQALADRESYQYSMAMTNPFTVENHLGFTSLSSVNTGLVPRTIDSSMLYSSNAPSIVTSRLLKESTWSNASMTQVVQVIDETMFKSNAGTTIHASTKATLDAMCAGLGGRACVMYTQKRIEASLWGNMHNTNTIKRDPIKNINNCWSGIDISDLPSIPGYSRVIMIEGMYQAEGPDLLYGGLVSHTYVPGPADVDHWCVHVVRSSSGSAFAEFAEYTFCLPNSYSSRVTDLKIPNMCTVKPTKALNLRWNGAALESMLRSDINQITYPPTSGALLVGVPLSNLRVLGTVKSAVDTVSVNSTDHVVTTYEVEPIDIEWTINKKWYQDYLRSGYGVFTPAVSNIQQNVLKQWDALAYDVITLRGTLNSYIPALSVSDLPEAKEYRRARAKACKSDDFLSQVAIAGTPVTWGEVSTKEKNAHGRQLWMNVTRPVLDFSKSKPYSYDVAVIYEKVEGKIFRKAAGASVQIDLNDEDVQAEIVLDRFYNKGASLVNVTWNELYPVTAEDEQIAKDSDMNYSTSVSISNKLSAVGFGQWIDPTGRADVRIMSDEPKYRLHIRNSVEFDKMSIPLWRVLSKFTYETIVNRLKA